MWFESHNSDSTVYWAVPPYGLVYRWGLNVSETFAASIVRDVTLKAEQEVLQKYRNLIKVFICQLKHKSFALKEILKFTLKMLRHVSV